MHPYSSVTPAFVTEQLHFYKYCVSGPIYDHKGAFVLGGCCVFVCGSTGLLFVEAVLGLPLQKEAVRHVPGLCGQWFGSLPDSQMAGVSVSFLSLAILFRSLTSSLSFFLPSPPLPSQMKTFPLVNRGRKSRVEDTTEPQKNMSLCGRGMFIMGVNMLLKRR